MNLSNHDDHEKKQDTAEISPIDPQLLGEINPELNFYHATDGILTLKTIGCHIRWKNRSIINQCTEKFVFHYILSGKGFFNGRPFDTEDVLYCSSNT
ncbi:MAG: hypothetical protein IKC59_03100, partial [Clostridia bacterium]|nr:hypothetical protein [Clostridia bacterium]